MDIGLVGPKHVQATGPTDGRTRPMIGLVSWAERRGFVLMLQVPMSGTPGGKFHVVRVIIECAETLTRLWRTHFLIWLARSHQRTPFQWEGD